MIFTIFAGKCPEDEKIPDPTRRGVAACRLRRTPKTEGDTLCVSILPLRSIVEGIVGEDFPIEVLVPAGPAPRRSSRHPGSLSNSTGPA